MIVSLIAAMAENRVIGREQDLPWHLPADLKRFKAITSGHPVIMGRKTFEALGKPLPGRPHVIITRQKDFSYPGVTVVHSVDEALKIYENTDQEVFVLGGGEIYAQLVDRCDKIYLTLIHEEFEGDTRFPYFDLSQFDVTFKEEHSDDNPEGLAFTFIDYQRK